MSSPRTTSLLLGPSLFSFLVSFLAPLPLARGPGAHAAPAVPEPDAPMAHGAGGATEAPGARGASDAAQAARLIRVPKGYKVDVWAAEPLLKNPVAFTFDERGRAFVVETFRHEAGVTDARGRSRWPGRAFRARATPEALARIGDELLDRELAARTIEDRLALMETYMDPASFTANAERVALVEDTNGDGRADRSKIFAGGFDDPLDGIAAGIVARKGEVFLTNIPSLWRLRDADGDGIADERRALQRGYGIRFGFIGHDLHGPRVGPDGRLYFSIGDRGAYVPTGKGPVAVQDTGAVFRCELDGTNLEVFADGLRNPHDLVFDERGNLFTGDNNSDGGDEARWVYLVEGGDSGWRVGYQWLEQPRRRGPWNAEKMWHERHAEQPAHLVPPVKTFSNGPSGVTYHPGTGLAGSLAGRFLLVDFRGQSGTSGVHSFRLEPDGASFRLVDPQRTIWGLLATDVEYGPDGAIYVLDWIEGWAKTGKGRIYRVYDPSLAKDPLAAETKRLIGEGMGRRAEGEIARLLAHPDQRVRQEAQFELAARGAVAPLAEAARAGQGNALARLHGVWGLGQVLRAAARAGKPAPAPAAATIRLLLDDRDPEVRGQAAQVAGDAGIGDAAAPLRARLDDPSPRVRAFAAVALGKVGSATDVPALFALLAKTGDGDPYVRHAAVLALAKVAGKSADVAALARAARHQDRAVRLGALLALRRLRRPEVSSFLRDADPRIVREAARAVNDAAIAGDGDGAGGSALAALAAVRPAAADEPTVLRVMNANYRLGTAAGARRLVAFAGDAAFPVPLRAEALDALAAWRTPRGRDRVTGAWRPLPPGGRDANGAAAALAPALRKLAGEGPEPVRLAALDAATRLALPGAAPTLAGIAGERAAPPAVRAAALRGLAAAKAGALPRLLAAAMEDAAPELRLAALGLALETNPAGAAPLVERAMAKGTLREKQTALRGLAGLGAADAERLLGRWLDDLAAGALPAELALDLLEAGAARRSPALEAKLAAYEKKRPDDDLGRFREALVGGDARQGRRIFFGKAEVQCMRCHRAGGPEVEGAGQVGPDLAGVGARRTREQLLEAIVVPSKTFAEGFESLLVTLKDGSIAGGIVKKETADALVLVSPEGVAQTVKKKDIKAREQGASGMPDGLAEILTRRELRDLVEFLATLR